MSDTKPARESLRPVIVQGSTYTGTVGGLGYFHRWADYASSDSGEEEKELRVL
jgi:hypothetical protein